MDKYTLGLKIKVLREQRNMTQVQFADMIHISDKALSKIEVGKNYPHLQTLMKIADAFDISLEFLIADGEIIDNDFYLNEIKDRISKLTPVMIQHIFAYVDLCLKLEKEYNISTDN